VFSRNQNTGDLTFVNSFSESQNNVSGLEGTVAITVSADDQQVYVTGTESNALVVFNRNPNTGELIYQEALRDGEQNVTDLDFPVALAVSDKFDEVYVADFGSNALLSFNRNERDSTLDFGFSERGSGLGITGLRGAETAVISPDGNFLYVAAKEGDAVSIFARNPENGSLTYLDYLEDGGELDGLNGATEIIISADGTDVYIAGFWDNTITHFQRDIDTGLLTFSDKEKDGLFGVDGVSGANSLVFSENENYVYAAGFWDNAIGIFARNTNDGTLEFIDAIFDGENGVDGLEGITKIILNTNQNKLYALGSAGASSVKTSADGKFIYVTAADDNAVAVFSCTYFFKETTTVCDGITVSLAGQDYDKTGLYQETIENENCIINIDLDLTVQPSEYDLAVDLCDGDIFILGDQAYNSSGTYSYNFISSIGCDSTVTVNLTVVDAFQPVNQIVEICEGDSFEIGGNSYSEQGTYDVVWPTSSGCDSTVVLDLRVEPVFTTTETGVLCQGEFFVFGNRNYTQSGVYTNLFSSATGCDSTVTLILSIYPGTTEIDAVVCEGESYDFAGQLYTETGSYQGIIMSNSGCEIETTLHLEVVEAITVEATITEDEGNGLGGITLQTIGGLPPYNYQWNNGVTINEVHNLTPGVYEVTITDANGCSEELSLSVNFVTTVEDINTISKINIFPNPNTTDQPLNVNLTSPSTQSIQLQVFTLMGEKIVDQKEVLNAGVNNLQMNLSMHSGIYLLAMVDENGVRVIRKIEIF